MYDLRLKGGTVVDPSMGLDGVHDVAVQDGMIAAIAPAIDGAEAARTIDVAGKIVTPGLIDLHAHVFDGVSRNGVHPDLGGVYAGVTTIVDAGSAGAATFGAFPRYVIPNCHTEVIPFLHIAETGLVSNPDIIAEESINLADTLRVCEQHQGLIGGIKARLVSPALEIMGMEMPRRARQAAHESGTRLMVHIGDTEKRYDPNVIRELLPMLEPGDIVTTCGRVKPRPRKRVIISVMLCTVFSRPGIVRSVLMQCGASPCSSTRRPTSKLKLSRPWAVSSQTPRSAASRASGTSLPSASSTPPGLAVKRWVTMSPGSNIGSSSRMTFGS